MTAAERRAAAAGRKAEAAERKAVREAGRAEKQTARKIERARKRLTRAGFAPGIKARLLDGHPVDAIVADLSIIADFLLAFDSWVPGPVGAVLETYDGPIIRAALTAVVRAVREGLVKSGVLAA